MGHFSVACAISGTSITGGPTYFLPLVSADRYGRKPKIEDIEPIVGSNEGALVMFAPYSLPILGEYSGYGNIEEIRNDIANKMFNARHDGLLTNHEFFIGGKSPKAYGIVKDYKFGETDKPVTGCFIKKWAWDSAVKYQMQLADWSCSVYNRSFMSDAMLEYAGFRKIGESDNKDERYKSIYQKPNYPKIKIGSDGEFTHIEGADHIYKFGDLQDYSIKKYGRPIFSKKEIAKLCSKNANAIEIHKGLGVVAETAKLFGCQEDKKIGPYLGLGFNYLVPTLCLPAIVEEDRSAAEKKAIIERCAEVMAVVSFLYLINKPLFPSFSGPQDGDRKAERYMAEQILVKRKNQ